MNRIPLWHLGLALASAAIVLGCRERTESGEAAGEPCTIGAIFPFSGTAAEIAEQHHSGHQLATNHPNLLGSDSLRVPNLVVEDGSNNPEQTLAAYSLLRERNLPLIVTAMSGPSMALVPRIRADSIVLFTNVGHPTISDSSTWIFRNFPSAALEASLMVDFAVNKQAWARIALYYIDDGYGRGAAKAIEANLAEAGGTLVMSEPYPADGSDFRTSVSNALELDFDALYVFGYGHGSASLLRQFADAGYDGPVLGTYNFALDPIKSEAEAAIAGSYITMPAFSSSDPDPSVQRFVAAYKDEFGTEPPWNAAVEFDAMAIITRAIGSKGDCSPASLKKGLESVGDFAGIVGLYRYNAATGEWYTELSIKQMQDGVPVDVLVGNEM